VDRVVADHPDDVQGLLYLGRQALADQATDVGVEVLALLAEVGMSFWRASRSKAAADLGERSKTVRASRKSAFTSSGMSATGIGAVEAAG
jgi:hypothetical protein